MPPYLFGDGHGGEAEGNRFAQHAERQAGLFFADRGEIWFDFVGPEFIDHLADGKMFFGQIFGRENILRRGIFD